MWAGAEVVVRTADSLAPVDYKEPHAANSDIPAGFLAVGYLGGIVLA